MGTDRSDKKSAGNKRGNNGKSAVDKRRNNNGSGFGNKGGHRRGAVKKAVDPDRITAYKALLRIDKAKAYSNIELNSILSEKDPADIVVNPAFVRELVYGVIKNRRYLDYFIDDLARDGIEGVRREIAILLRMGLYQIIFMDSVPEHSAVDETVKITKLLFPGRDGFVNGLLRSFIRKQNTYYSKPSDDSRKSESVSENKRDDVSGSEPVSDNKRDIPVPNITDPIRRISVMYSCDEGLVRLLAGQYGTEKAEEILRVSLETPPLYVRVNTIKTSSADLISSLTDKGFKADDQSPDFPDTLVVSGKGILETKEFKDGLFFVQDASSSQAMKEFGPEPGETLIDVCAAPGGKSFAAAILMDNSGVIHAMDLHGNKLRALTKQAKRLGITIIDTEEHDAKTINKKYAASSSGNNEYGADKVLCDVPCSGLGVLRRKPEIKDRPLLNDGRDLAEIQYRILCSSADYVKPGGELMYSTCTLNRIENEKVTDRFIAGHDGFRVRCSKLTMPCSGGPDGFYYCIMQRVK
ncbi:MAG: hypothetical protein IKF07_08255 [Eubacterium sp.]|nr:hypothetical protein [Eubacterium sp.]